MDGSKLKDKAANCKPTKIVGKIRVVAILNNIIRAWTDFARIAQTNFVRISYIVGKSDFFTLQLQKVASGFKTY